VATGPRVLAEIGLKNPRRADRQKIFIDDRLRHQPAALNERLRIVAGTNSLTVRFADRRQAVAEIGQALAAQQRIAVREAAERLL